MWAGGDCHSFARSALWDFGPLPVEATGISPGQRVLDVPLTWGQASHVRELFGDRVESLTFERRAIDPARCETSSG